MRKLHTCSLLVAAATLGACAAVGSSTTPAALATTPRRALLDELARRATRYFLDHQHPQTGLVLDRARNRSSTEPRTVASIAATGFGLLTWSIAAERGWISRNEAQTRCLRTLRFVADRLEHREGFLFHFVDARNGQRVWNCELSSIDTALFLTGALFAGATWPGTEIARRANRLYQRVDFEWMRTNGGTRPEATTLCMGWKPETGFLEARWQSYDESPLLYLLAVGSPTHPIPATCWWGFERPRRRFEDLTVIGGDLPLFVHQYATLLVDPRGWPGQGPIDWWANSRNATLWNRRFARARADRFPAFATFWGLSACDGPRGYRAYAPIDAKTDGTVCPSAALASLAFTPELVVDDLRQWLSHPRASEYFGLYGFADGLNLDRDWVGEDVIGITLGPLVIAIENDRNAGVWTRCGRIAPIAAANRRIDAAARRR